MNTIVSAVSLATATAIPPIAAAVPTIAPIIPARDSSPAAALARAEEAVSLLRTRYIRKGWKINEPAAERALAYCRQYAAEGSDPDDERKAAFDFFRSHGQPIDWICDGDHNALICGLARHSEWANGTVDAELVKLTEECIKAEQKWCDFDHIADLMDIERIRHRPRSEVLRWRKADGELGLPTLFAGDREHESWWDRPIDVNPLRKEKWWKSSRIETEEENSFTRRAFVPSDAARARADEIIAAFDEWNKEGKPPRGYKKAKREANRASRDYERLKGQIAGTRATTFDGMLAKVNCARGFEKRRIAAIDRGGAEELMALSIFEDLGSAGTPAVAAFLADRPIEPDPIFAAIDAHRTAWTLLEHNCSALTEAAHDNQEARQKLDTLHDAISEAEGGLLDVVPTTVAGAAAILTYAADHVRRGGEWGTGYEDVQPLSGWCSTHGVPWEVILHQNVATALSNMNTRSRTRA